MNIEHITFTSEERTHIKDCLVKVQQYVADHYASKLREGEDVHIILGERGDRFLEFDHRGAMLYHMAGRNFHFAEQSALYWSIFNCEQDMPALEGGVSFLMDWADIKVRIESVLEERADMRRLLANFEP